LLLLQTDGEVVLKSLHQLPKDLLYLLDQYTSDLENILGSPYRPQYIRSVVDSSNRLESVKVSSISLLMFVFNG